MSTEKRPDEELPAELKGLERALGELAPAAADFDRDRMMYLAGRASVLGTAGAAPSRPLHARFAQRNWWPLITAALVLVSVAMGGALLRGPRVQERIVYLRSETDVAHADMAPQGELAMNAVGARASDSYFQLRNTVLNGGVDALPAQPGRSPGSTPQTHGEHIPTMRDDFWGS